MKRRNPGIGYRRSKKINILPYAALLLLALLVGWLGFKLFGVLFGGTTAEALKAELVVDQGKAEFKLLEQEQWTNTVSNQPFYAGDSLKTRPNSSVNLEMDGATVYVNEDTEMQIVKLNKDGNEKTHIELNLINGQLWSKANDSLAEKNEDRYVITTPLSRIYGADAMFDVQTGPQGDIVRVLAGEVTAEVMVDKEKEKTKAVKIGVGQKAELMVANLEKIAEGTAPLTAVETEFEESEWNLNALAPFDPQKVAEIRQIIEAKAPQVAATPKPSKTEIAKKEEAAKKNTTDKKNFKSPTISSPSAGAKVEANPDDQIVIVGKASPGTAKVHAKSSLQTLYYTLQKFESGDTEWRFLVSKEFKSLKFGENIIQVYAEDADGNTSPVVEHRFSYEGAKEENVIAPDSAPVVEAVETNNSISSGISISAPVISNPPRSPFQTAAPVITIRGTVSQGTNAIEVNGFRLKNFKIRDTSFQYTANAEYGNLEQGNNNFKITAFGPGNEQASTNIVVIYTPLDIPKVTAKPAATQIPKNIQEQNAPPKLEPAQTSNEVPYNPNPAAAQ